MATDIERAWHVFTFHPGKLSPRFYRSHLETFGIDRRIAVLKESGEWPPRVVLATRWPDIGDLLRLTAPDEVHAHAITLDTGQRLALVSR